VRDATKSLTAFGQDSTVVAQQALLKLLHRWRIEATQAGHQINRMVVAYEAGRDGLLVGALSGRATSRHMSCIRRASLSHANTGAKTDRLDTELLMRALLGCLRGERRHCSMAAIPTVAEEDARRSNRERERPGGPSRPALVNRMKAMLARFRIRAFKPQADNEIASLCG
jgi:transposase